MSKYNYSKKGLKGLTPFKFLKEAKTRVNTINEAPSQMPNSIFNANILARSLHPGIQHVIVDEVKDLTEAKSFKLVADKENGTDKLAYFRAGQYVSVNLKIGDTLTTRPYTISSNPKDALLKENSSYTLTIKKTESGFASNYILDNWKKGEKVNISGPLGEFYYEGLRDSKNVIALAGGSGITPFISMASAIADGIEDFNLTILYGSKTSKQILLKEELDEIVNASKGKVKVIHVLSNEENSSYENGFITADLIKKYAPNGDYSIYMCGPKAMYDFLEKEIAKLNLPKRRWRKELSGDIKNVDTFSDYPLKDDKQKEFKLSVVIKGEKQEITCKANESLLIAMERASIKVPSHCRSGECGWCHSRLISGEVYIPSENDGRRIADKKFNWIHPCCSFPLSDIELEIYPIE